MLMNCEADGMESSGSKKVEPDADTNAEESRPYRYHRTFGVGRNALHNQVEEVIGDDQDAVSSFVDELLRSSAVGREFAKNSLSFKNLTREKGEDISTDL
jgi:hypothetical protein